MTNEIASDIIDVFEDFLAMKGIVLKNPEKDEEKVPGSSEQKTPENEEASSQSKEDLSCILELKVFSLIFAPRAFISATNLF